MTLHGLAVSQDDPSGGPARGRLCDWLSGVTRTARLSVPILALLALAGCSQAGSGGGATPTVASHASSPLSASGGATTDASTTTSSASSGTTLTSRSGGFSVVPAPGWSVATDQVGDVPGLDLVLLSSTRVGSFSNNLVIIASDGDQAKADAELAKGRSDLGGKGTVTDLPAKQVAGETAKGIATAFSQEGVAVLARSYSVHHDGKVYLLTLSSSQEDAGTAMEEFDRILSTWTWL